VAKRKAKEKGKLQMKKKERRLLLHQALMELAGVRYFLPYKLRTNTIFSSVRA